MVGQFFEPNFSPVFGGQFWEVSYGTPRFGGQFRDYITRSTLRAQFSEVKFCKSILVGPFWEFNFPRTFRRSIIGRQLWAVGYGRSIIEGKIWENSFGR